MSEHYYVSPRRGVLDKDGMHHAPGSQVSADLIADPERLLRLGFLVKDEPVAVEPEPVLKDGEGGPPPQWDRDPKELEGLELDQLNVMIGEIDASIPPFETVEEAVLWLSQDFAG
jgi:hypothetical protein